ncbi:uncharacterized protein DSM5745_02312 [Aspergillus mulundensis]|uniref:Hydroxybutyrate dehydrogenase n=1 Tax=Aspergillus mulundensis TaxID=1810919 RepID=A0A3D8SW39_9EURO|nr:hypothetical protein DSM5745_02312 [Aspergillus mulundensis]RDW90537.1 hypothetical protein DSM5745_02312 [Aspergillus mulundensis]
MASRKTVLITGCSDDGIGSGLALTFQQQDYHVFATARNVEKISKLRDLPNVTLLALDVCNKDHIAAAVEAVSQHLDTGGKLNYLTLYDTNVWGPLALTQAFAPRLIQAHGTVAFITSIAGHLNVPYMGTYSASKRSLEIIAETLRLELAPFHVRVLSVVTGAVKTMGQTYFEDFRLPQDSLYRPVEATIAARAQGGDGNRREELGAYSEKVVHEIINGTASRFWCGAGAGSMRFGTALLPGSLLDNAVSQGTGVDVLAGQNKL